MIHTKEAHLADWQHNLEIRLARGESSEFPSEGPKIVVIGGGSGSSRALRGLKQHTSRLTAIVTMFDSGGSSGLLRYEFGYPPFGDLRQCLMALSEDSTSCQTLNALLGFRFGKNTSLRGHNLGNLLMAALASQYDLEEAIDRLARVLRIRGQVVPVSLDQAELCALLEDGSLLKSETVIDCRDKPIPKIGWVFLEPAVKANPRAVQAIQEADAIVIGPGDLYTSIIPNLCVEGIPQALSQTKAMLIYVCNLMTKSGETDHFRASDFVREINRYIHSRSVDWAVVNTAPVPPRTRERYAHQGAEPVESDLDRLEELGVKTLRCSLASDEIPLRHDPATLADTIMSLVSAKWLPDREYHPLDWASVSL